MGYSFLAKPRSSLRNASPIMRCKTRLCSGVKMGLRPRVLLGYVTMLWQSPDSWIRFMKNCGDFIRFAKNNKRRGEVAVSP